jgi:3,4-dihydroxy 2-butanone 4-phosphate synthase/GTP cyclohydrolase II
MSADTPISSVEDIIEDARQGRPFILVDAEDRENEGDIVIPAQFATPDQINFMAKHGRGLICLAITQERSRQLRLPPMAVDNQTPHGTAFTVSIEAKEGVTTGISAHDRARTVAVAIDATKGPDDIVTPGHVFPLVAREGGVLVRTGHTEAAVDIARLAGLQPAGVICEIMNDDGTMARLPDLIAFSQLHGLKIGAISDLIAYRRRTEHFVERILETPFESAYGGHFRLYIYRNTIDRAEHLALVRGRIDPDKATMVRVHQIDPAADVLGHVEARRDYVPQALRTIADYDGAGVALFLRDPSPTFMSDRFAGGHDHAAAVLRDVGVGSQILLDLGVRQMILLTSNPARLPALEGYGLKVVDRRPIPHEE